MERISIAKLIISISVLLASISAGCFLVVSMEPADKEHIFFLIDGYLFGDNFTFPSPFLHVFLENSILLLLLFLLSRRRILFPLSLCLLFSKALSLGFSSAIIVESYGLAGITSLLIHIFPQNFFIFTAFLLSMTVNTAFFRRKTMLIFLALLWLLILLGSLIQTLIFSL